MRFSAPRSLSPSPVRRPRTNERHSRSSTFGLNGNSDDDSDGDQYAYVEDSSDSESVASSSSSRSSSYVESGIPKRPLMASTRSTEEQRQIEDSVAAVRLRTRHHDPYEEWERKARKDAFRSAQRQQKAIQSQLHNKQDIVHSKESERLAALHHQQISEVQQQLNTMRLYHQNEEEKLREEWKKRDEILWKRIEHVIKLEEDKVRARLQEERRIQEEEDKKRQEEELKRRLEEEKRKSEAEQKRLALEEEKRLKEEKERKEQEARQAEVEEERKRQQRLEAEATQREEVGMTTAEQDWKQARRNLQMLKSGTMKLVKSDKGMRTEWGHWRRQITPKIGQLTNDGEAIARISQQLYHILVPDNRHHPAIYTALLSSLAKAIILQAETEVTAKKDSAEPLAHVAFNLLGTLDGFPEVLFAKIVQRVGGWPIPCNLPPADFDGRPWTDEAEKAKARGLRKVTKDDGRETFESDADYSTRIAGIMRVYFCILRIPPERPLKPMFQLPRYWTWFARLLSETYLLENVAAAQMIYTALDVLGHDAKRIWGRQFVKVLALVYKGVKEGFASERFIGGTSIEGKAARVRVELMVEKIMDPS